MYNNPPLAAQIEAAQQQLNTLKQTALQQYATPTYQQPVLQQPQDIQQLVRNEINSYLNQLQQQVQPIQPPTPTNPLEAKINEFASSILSPEQIKWINDPTIISTLPVFFKSEKGKQAIQLVYEEFKAYVNR